MAERTPAPDDIPTGESIARRSISPRQHPSEFDVSGFVPASELDTDVNADSYTDTYTYTDANTETEQTTAEPSTNQVDSLEAHARRLWNRIDTSQSADRARELWDDKRERLATLAGISAGLALFPTLTTHADILAFLLVVVIFVSSAFHRVRPPETIGTSPRFQYELDRIKSASNDARWSWAEKSIQFSTGAGLGVLIALIDDILDLGIVDVVRAVLRLSGTGV